MEASVAESRRDHFSEMVLEHVQALSATRDGRLSEAERHSRSAVEMAMRAGLQERTAVFQAAPAVWNALYENIGIARANAETRVQPFLRQHVPNLCSRPCISEDG